MKRGTMVLLGLGALAGFVLGWLMGSWSTCRGRGCSFDVALFEAIGTWVGGVGTVVAIWFVWSQIRHDIRRDERATGRETEAALAAARRVKLRAKPLKLNAGRYTAVGVTTSNKSDRTLINVQLVSADGTVLARAEQVDPTRDWLVTITLDKLDHEPVPEADAPATVRTAIEPELAVTFSIDSLHFKRTRSGIEQVSDKPTG